jgi:hypothetical protein
MIPAFLATRGMLFDPEHFSFGKLFQGVPLHFDD